MNIYTGYIVRQNEKNPYSVWIPAKNHGGPMKRFKTFGTNTQDIAMTDILDMQSAAEKCYVISPLNSQGDYIYDEITGFATVEEHNPNPDNNDIANLRYKKASNRYSAPGDGEVTLSAHSYPAANILQTFLFDSTMGTPLNSYNNYPGGRYTTLPMGMRVLIVYPDNGGTGYIVGQIPSPDNISTALYNFNN
jgi:hypothetical protein